MNRYARPVCFAMEPDVVSLFAYCSFGAAGAPTLTALKSKGFCNVTRVSISITGDISNTSTTVSNVSSFAGLYVGMGISGTGIPASTTISSMTPGSGTLVLSQAATATTSTLAITVAGGQFKFQLGSVAGVNLDVYPRLLGMSALWDASGSQGGASTGALVPDAPGWFLVSNRVATRTIPATSTSPASDATFTLQFGTWSGGTFVAKDPENGEVLYLAVQLTRSTAI